jgi:hypothetical protein
MEAPIAASHRGERADVSKKLTVKLHFRPEGYRRTRPLERQQPERDRPFVVRKRSAATDPKPSVAIFCSSDRSTFDTGHSLNLSSRSSFAVAVIRRCQPTSGSGSQLNGRIRKSRAYAHDPLLPYDPQNSTPASSR